MTQWDQFCARPVEVPVQGGGRGAGGGGGAGAGGGRGGRGSNPGDINPVNRIWGIIGMSQPGGGAGGRGGGGGRGFGGAELAPTGDYLVTLTIGGQTYKQTFRVEQSNTGGSSSPFPQEEEGKKTKSK